CRKPIACQQHLILRHNALPWLIPFSLDGKRVVVSSALPLATAVRFAYSSSEAAAKGRCLFSAAKASFACNTDCIGSYQNPDAASLQNKARFSSSDSSFRRPN